MSNTTGKQKKPLRKRQPKHPGSPDVRASRSPQEQELIEREWEQQGHEWEAEGHERVYPGPGWQEGGYGHERQGYEWERPEKGRVQSAHTRKPRRKRSASRP